MHFIIIVTDLSVWNAVMISKSHILYMWLQNCLRRNRNAKQILFQNQIRWDEVQFSFHYVFEILKVFSLMFLKSTANWTIKIAIKYITSETFTIKKYKTFSVFIYSYINTSGNWKNEKLCGNTTPAGRSVFIQFRVFPIFASVDITVYQYGKKCFIFLL